VSKTLNVGDTVTYDEFKQIYMRAWEGGCKGCTTFRAAGKRYGILKEVKDEDAAACYIDPETGKKTCE
jgi:ribonucleoside-diphosphate reductase alpha chain